MVENMEMKNELIKWVILLAFSSLWYYSFFKKGYSNQYKVISFFITLIVGIVVYFCVKQ